MNIYEIPRDYKGESRILFVFSSKGLIYTVVGVLIGLIPYLIFKILGLNMVGVFIVGIFGLIGFSIGTFKMPDSKRFSITEKTGGEQIDDVIKRWLMFKKKKNKIYVYTKEELKNE
ncbi:MAG: PrgI family protein [Clostridia bacterium]|nr:PrgI family protein [Clostridia bacterium]